MSVDSIVATVAKLTSYKNKIAKQTGTGFFYDNTSGLHFVTNRHNVIKEDEGFVPDEISLRLHTDPKNLEKNDDYFINLYSDDIHIWKEHPIHGNKVDVIAIPIGDQEFTKKYSNKAFSPKTHLPNNVEMSLGQELTVIGFPKGVSDEKYNLPIARDASLASSYPVPFQGNPFVLIDAHLHGGTSGSPVITRPMNMQRKSDGSMAIMTGNPRYLLGIHSASIDVKETKDQDPLGLNCMWFASLIDEITR